MLAQSLFEDGRRLLEKGDVAAACAKLAESHRLDPAGGTLLNLALCHEREGKVGTAYVELVSALAQAQRDGRDDRAAIAREHLAAIEHDLPRLVVSVPHAPAGAEITLDGTALREAAWGSAMAVDPGPHAVRARAPGHRELRVDVTSRRGETRTVELALERDPTARVAESRPAAGEARTPRTRRERHPLSVPLMVTGGALSLVGAASGAFLWAPLYFGSRATGSEDAARATGLDTAETAAGVVALVGLGVGVPMLITGLVLPHRDVPVAASVTRDSAMLMLRVPLEPSGR